MLALWTANRPGVTRTLRWSELDLETGVWTIAKNREGMKRGYLHYTPLPHQAVERLKEVRALTGTFEYVFAGRLELRRRQFIDSDESDVAGALIAIAQDVDAHIRKLLGPCVGVGEVFVISQRQEHRRLQFRQRCDFVFQCSDGAVDDIAGDAHKVDVLLIDRVDHLSHQ